MDNEKLDKANLLTKGINALKSQLERTREVRTRGDNHPESCAVTVYGEKKMIDHDIFEIALFAQEKRIQIELEKLEKEFASL